MTSEYVCSECHRLVSVTGEPGEWILTWCKNCGFEVKVMIEDDQKEPSNDN